MDFRWIYEHFFIRDGLGYVLPGSIVLVSGLLLFDPVLVQGMLAGSALLSALVWIPLAFAAATLVQHLATFLRILAIDHNAGILADSDRDHEDIAWGWHKATEPILATLCLYAAPSSRYEARVVAYYKELFAKCPRETARHVHARQVDFKHICGNMSVALFVLALSRDWMRDVAEASTSTPPWFNLLEELHGSAGARAVIWASAFSFLIAHYRHARFQYLMSKHIPPAEEIGLNGRDPTA